MAVYSKLLDKNKVGRNIKNYIKILLSNNRNAFISSVLDIATFSKIENIKLEKIERICIVVPELYRYSGGHTSIARLGTYLCKKGISVDYMSYVNQPREEMAEVIRNNYPPAKGNCIGYKDNKNDYDVVIATNWVSVYYAKRMKGYKIYFVQDYEPYFFQMGEEYVLAEQTYQFGFHIVSLGKWNIKEIQKNIDAANLGMVDFIDFPYEPAEYEYKKRNFNHYKSKMKYTIAVYSKENGKRLHNIIEYILTNANEKLKEYGITLDVRFFGLNREFNVKIGTNLGKLNTDEMKKLFYEADFGMSASLTNISLVPLEMMASGLPVIEFKDGSYTSFFSEESALLINYDYNDFVEKIVQCINNPHILEKMDSIAKDELDRLSWEDSCKQFCSILQSIETEDTKTM